LRKMKKNKIDAFNNMPSVFFKNEAVAQEEQIINLRLELPDKLVSNFKLEQNEQVCKEIEHILRDDDDDLLYYDK
jgi:hypothetical protein